MRSTSCWRRRFALRFRRGGRCARRYCICAGDDALGQESVASMLAHRSSRNLLVLRHEDTPAAGAELEQFLHLWMRERLLLPAFLLLQWGHETPSVQARQLAERIPGALMIASRESIRLHRAVETHVVNKPSPAAQQRLWLDALGAAAPGANPAPRSRSCWARLPSNFA